MQTTIGRDYQIGPFNLPIHLRSSLPYKASNVNIHYKTLKLWKLYHTFNSIKRLGIISNLSRTEKNSSRDLNHDYFPLLLLLKILIFHFANTLVIHTQEEYTLKLVQRQMVAKIRRSSHNQYTEYTHTIYIPEGSTSFTQSYSAINVHQKLRKIIEIY